MKKIIFLSLLFLLTSCAGTYLKTDPDLDGLFSTELAQKKCELEDSENKLWEYFSTKNNKYFIVKCKNEKAFYINYNDMFNIVHRWRDDVPLYDEQKKNVIKRVDRLSWKESK